jgi:8-oxo-dGTP diphosphatase
VALGWEHFADWVEDISIPVFALGGLSPAQAGLARLHGGQGVAGIRGFLEE